MPVKQGALDGMTEAVATIDSLKLSAEEKKWVFSDGGANKLRGWEKWRRIEDCCRMTGSLSPLREVLS